MTRALLIVGENDYFLNKLFTIIHNYVEEKLNDADHQVLQVAVLKEELLGDKGYEDIHCQVMLLMMLIMLMMLIVIDDVDYADDVDSDVFRRRILTAKSCSAHLVGIGVLNKTNAL